MFYNVLTDIMHFLEIRKKCKKCKFLMNKKLKIFYIDKTD